MKLLTTLGLATALTFATTGVMAESHSEEPLKIGFIYVGPIGDFG